MAASYLNWCQPPWLMAGSYLIWSPPPWLIAGSLKFDLDCLGGCLALWNLISTTLVERWFTEIWSRLSWSMSDSLKLDLGSLGWWLLHWHLSWWLVHWNLISTVLIDVWFTLNLISSTLVDGRFTEIWSRPSGSMASSLKLEPDRLGRWLLHT